MSLAWQDLPERGSIRALALIHWIGSRLGRGSARALLYPIALYFLFTAPAQRRASRRYLCRILGRDPGWTGVLRHIHCFACTILDRLFLLGGQLQRFDIRVHNGPLILEQMASGRGCLLLSAHLGSFEVLRTIGITGRQLPIRVLMNIDHNKTISRFVSALNPQMAETIIPIRGAGTLLAVKESLDAGYLVGVLADRVVREERSVTCDFLGAPAAFPAGPLSLAAALECRVLLAFGLYRGGNRYDVSCEVLSEAVPVAARRSTASLAPLVQRYADRLAWYARQAPYNWFNFFDFWAEGGRDRSAA